MKSMITRSATHTAILLIISMLTLFTSSCKPGAEAPAKVTGTGSDDMSGLVLEDIPGSKVKYARQINAQGQVEIQGFVEDGKKTGQWIQYGPEGDIILINNYIDGLLEGTAMRMTFRNQVDLKLNYKQGKLDGPWVSYKFGKIIEERQYANDKLEGVAKTYDERTFKVKQEVQYKDGLQDGYFRYYDEAGNITLEYQYKKGEKVSGGIVEPAK